MAEDEPPWSVEVPASEVRRLLGPEGSTLKRLSAATGCEIEVSKQRKRRGKTVSFQGQDQVVDDNDDASSAAVKVYIRGVARKRAIAAEVIQAVVDGDDPEDHAARAEGALVLPHEIRHPDREAWARWRLQSVAHGHGASAHLGRCTMRLALKQGGSFSDEAAERLASSANTVIAEASTLAELSIDARDDLEPESAPSDPAVAPFVDQHGVIIRVADQDDNAVSETMTVRVVGPPEASHDVVALLRARFVEGKVTATVLQTLDQVQSMTSEMAKDFAGDLQSLESECMVKVTPGRSALCIAGCNSQQVAEAKKMLQDMLQFYIPTAFSLVEGLTASAIERLYADEELGVLMCNADCVVMIDDCNNSVWICGKLRAAVQKRIDEAVRIPSTGDANNGEPRGKRRRTSALSFHSELLG